MVQLILGFFIVTLVLCGCSDKVTRFPSPDGRLLAEVESRCPNNFLRNTSLVLTEENAWNHGKDGWRLDIEVTCGHDGSITKYIEEAGSGNGDPHE